MDKKAIWPFFEKEMTENPELYVDATCNVFVHTYLAEAYINEQDEMSSEDEELVHESVIDWFEQWKNKNQYNN